MLKNTKTKLTKALKTEPAGNRRANMIKLYHMSASPTIAESIINNTRGNYGVTLLCEILASCGAAKLTKSDKETGYYTFEDGSQLWDQNWK